MRKLLALALFAVSAFAADVTGTWTAAVDLDAGSGSATFVFKQAGEQLTGTYTGALGEAKLTGTVSGDRVEWSFDTADAGKVKYSGSLDGAAKIKGTCEYGAVGKGTFVAQKK
jgi:hypothetical protein